MAEALTIPRDTTFTKYDGTSSRVRIVDEEYIRSGIYGMIYRTDTLVSGRPRRFVIKKFKKTLLSAQGNAERAFANYQRAKDAGLKVFATYRLGEDRKSILMTDGSGDSTVCLSNNITLPELGLSKIRDEALPLDLVDGIIANAKKASEQKILIPNDAYFFLYDRQAECTDFVLGDLDTLGKDVDSQHALRHNLQTAKLAILGFIASNAQNSYYQSKVVKNKFADEGVM